MPEPRSWTRAWTVAGVVIGAGVVGLVVYIATHGPEQGGGDGAPPAEIHRVPIGEAPVKGPADALVTIVEFSDFQCPHCREAAATLARLLERSPGDVRVAFRHAPLASRHPQALDAAAAAMAAHDQGRFWEYHDLLFASQGELDERGGALLLDLARQLHLDEERFEADVASYREGGRIEADCTLLRDLGVGVVPALFVNGRLLLGAVPLEELQALVEAERCRAREALARGVERTRLYEAMIEGGVGPAAE